MKTMTNKYVSFTAASAAMLLNLAAQAQTFTLDYPMQAARWDHTATLLPNGQVLIAGGKIANNFATSDWANTNSCELYDPALGIPVLTGPMADSHAAGAAILLPNGQVLIFAGENNGTYPIASAELYDPGSGAWTSTGSMHQQREAFASVLLPNGKVFVAGGWDGGGAGELSSVEIYDPNTKVWTNAAPMSSAADSQTATVLPDGTVLVAAGSNNGNVLTNAFLYYPASNTWSNTGSLKVALYGHSATLLPDGRVLVVGGGDSAQVYNPTNHTWTLVASMNDGRSFPSATLLPNGQVLVLGGDPWQTTAELYNPTNNTWTYTGSLNVGRLFHTATLVSGGQVVVAGGDAGTIGYWNGPPLADVETYNQSALVGLFSYALNTTNMAWITSGDANWFVENTNSYDGVAAAQSGSVTNSQISILTTTVTGPGILTFYWSSIANDTNGGFDYEFYLDDSGAGDLADLYGTNDWAKAGPFTIPAGQHTLGWMVSANGDTDPTQAGFLDQVTFVSTAPVAGPIGWWKGDGNALDSAGANNGTLQGSVTYAPGILGQAFDFDGSGDYVQLPGVSTGQPEGTISLWTYLRNWNWQSAGDSTFLWAGTQYLPSTGTWDGINLGNHRSYTSTGELLFGIFAGDWQWAHSGVVPQTNTWYHLAGTWGAGGIQIYVNGQLKGTNSYTGPAPDYTVYNLIGRSSWPNTQINGLVDDVRLYNRALSASEINSLAHPINNPTLAIISVGTNVLVSWPAAASSFTLESTPSLGSPHWTSVTNPVPIVNSNYVFTSAASGSARFFRLKQ